MMHLQLAWRNIWRNRKRSMITMASVMFAVVLAILMKSMITGVWGKMVDDVVCFSSGYIQIHRQGYWDDRSIDQAMREDDQLLHLLVSDPEITAWAPRLESFSLASAGEKTTGVFIQGIEPAMEQATTRLADKLSSGTYLQPDDRAVMLAEGLAQRLKIGVHDTVVLLGQGYHGNLAAARYPVRGIVHIGAVELNQSMVWIPLNASREYFSADQLLTSVSVMLRDNDDMEAVRDRMMLSNPDNTYEIMTWKEMLPELDQMVEGDSAAHFLVIYVLYFVISFGIFGTLLMMLNERMHEFGILLAIGMKKRIMALITVAEVLMMALAGTLAGGVISYPVLLYLYRHPIRFSGELAQVYEGFGMEAILRPELDPAIFLSQTYIVLIIVALLSLYPAIKIARLKVIRALNA